MSVFFDLTGKCRIKTVEEAIAFAKTQVMDITLYKKREEIFYLKLAKMMKGIGALRAAGRCYMMALQHSLMNEYLSNKYGEFVCASKPEKIYKIALHFYVDLGSYNYLKNINKYYRKWSTKTDDMILCDTLTDEYLKKGDLNYRLSVLLGEI